MVGSLMFRGGISKTFMVYLNTEFKVIFKKTTNKQSKTMSMIQPGLKLPNLSAKLTPKCILVLAVFESRNTNDTTKQIPTNSDIQLGVSTNLQPLDQQSLTIQQQDFTTLPINISGAVTMTTLSSLNPQIKITEVGQMGSLSTKRTLSVLENTTNMQHVGQTQDIRQTGKYYKTNKVIYNVHTSIFS